MFKENAYVTNWSTEVTSLKSRISQSGHYLCSPPFQNSLSKHNPTPVSWAPRPPRDSAPVAIASRSESSVSPSSRFFLSTYGRALGFYLHRKKRNTQKRASPLSCGPHQRQNSQRQCSFLTSRCPFAHPWEFPYPPLSCRCLDPQSQLQRSPLCPHLTQSSQQPLRPMPLFLLETTCSPYIP